MNVYRSIGRQPATSLLLMDWSFSRVHRTVVVLRTKVDQNIWLKWKSSFINLSHSKLPQVSSCKLEILLESLRALNFCTYNQLPTTVQRSTFGKALPFHLHPYPWRQSAVATTTMTFVAPHGQNKLTGTEQVVIRRPSTTPSVSSGAFSHSRPSSNQHWPEPVSTK